MSSKILVYWWFLFLLNMIIHPVFQMKVDQPMLIKGIAYLSIVTYVIFALFDLWFVYVFPQALMFPLLLYSYLKRADAVSKCFIGFLLGFTMSGIDGVMGVLFEEDVFSSHIANSFFLFAYFCLFVFFLKKLKLLDLIRRFWAYMIVLLVFDVYIVFNFNLMMLECECFLEDSSGLIFEYTYNVFVILVLSFSLLNYLYNDTKRELFLFLAIASIAFSEMVQVVVLFSAQNTDALVTPYLLLLGVGYYFLYKYTYS